MRTCAIGFADHSGWAIAVAIAIDGSDIRVLHRDRITVIGPGIPRQAYHAVAEEGAPRSIIAAAEESGADCARRAVESMRAALVAAGFEVVAAGVPAGTTVLPGLESVLASHTLLHAAEGELYREALAEGATRAGIPVVLRVPRKEVLGLAAGGAGITLAAWTARLTALRAPLGAPWTTDHKLAASAAWLALASANAGQQG